MRIHIVDDVIQESLMRLLDQAGHEVTCDTSFIDFRRTYENKGHRFDLIIFDGMCKLRNEAEFIPTFNFVTWVLAWLMQQDEVPNFVFRSSEPDKVKEITDKYECDFEIRILDKSQHFVIPQ